MYLCLLKTSFSLLYIDDARLVYFFLSFTPHSDPRIIHDVDVGGQYFHVPIKVQALLHKETELPGKLQTIVFGDVNNFQHGVGEVALIDVDSCTADRTVEVCRNGDVRLNVVKFREHPFKVLRKELAVPLLVGGTHVTQCIGNTAVVSCGER